MMDVKPGDEIKLTNGMIARVVSVGRDLYGNTCYVDIKGKSSIRIPEFYIEENTNTGDTQSWRSE